MTALILASLATIGEMPAWTYPDTEVSTNVAHVFSAPGTSEVRLALDADLTPSNCVCVAFGKDLDEDGELSLDEARLVAGWDCGAWFCRGERTFERDGNEFRLRLHGETLDWNLIRVTVRGTDAAHATVVAGAYSEGLVLRIK